MFTLRPFWAVVLASSLAAGSPTYAFQESVTAEGTEAVTGQPNASSAASAGQPGRILARALELVPTIISERNAPRTLALQSSGGSTGTGVSGELIAATVISLAGGAGALAYGSSDACKTSGANGTSECGLAKGAGIGFLVLGVIFLIAMGSSGSSKTVSTPQQPRANATPLPRQTPPPSFESASPSSSSSNGLPPMQVSRSANGATAATITNQTPYALQISFSGPISTTMTVAPGATQGMELAPGQYQETAQVLGGALVAPFSGAESIRQGYNHTQVFVLVQR